MRIVHLAPLAILVAATCHASADGLYVLAQASHSRDTLQRGDFDGALLSAGATGVSSSATGGSNQFRLQAGYRFDPHWAAELGYIDFGKSTYSSAFAGGTAQGSSKAGGLDVVGLIMLPFDSGFALFGKAGIVDATVKYSLSSAGSTTFSQGGSARAVRPLIGAGASFGLSEHLDMRADVDYVNGLGKSSQGGTMNATMASVGVAYKF